MKIGSRVRGPGSGKDSTTRAKPIVVTAAIIEKDGRILIAKRKSGWRHAGKWEFPGGKIEPNETPEECLRRELFEELNIDAEVAELYCDITHAYGYATIQLLVYRARHVSGEYTLADHDEMRWVLPAELQQYEFPEADTPVVAKLAGAASRKERV
jgi:8-oxo-dGTP diphosphatase